MNTGFQFEKTISGVRFRVLYTTHFVQRYEIGEPEIGRQPVKRTVQEETIRQKAEEALEQISEIAEGDPDAEGVIVARRNKFVMVFGVIERQDGYQINMVSTSPGLNFKAKSPKDYIITVNPIFEVIFVSDISYALKITILADLAANCMELEDGGTFHLGGTLMDYWVERTGNKFHVIQADWARPIYEVQVS